MSIEGYIALPIKTKAFQFFFDEDKPEWLNNLYLEGSFFTCGKSQKYNNPVAIMKNKRGTYTAFEGDWICEDQFGHIFVISRNTFSKRFKSMPNTQGAVLTIKENKR